jgi:hypothetical protein
MKKTYDEIAEEVIAGKWGDGAEREKKLTAAGYDFRAINKMASEKIKIYLTLGKRYYIV